MGLFRYHWCLFVKHLHLLWELITLSEGVGPDGFHSWTLVQHSISRCPGLAVTGLSLAHIMKKREGKTQN